MSAWPALSVPLPSRVRMVTGHTLLESAESARHVLEITSTPTRRITRRRVMIEIVEAISGDEEPQRSFWRSWSMRN